MSARMTKTIKAIAALSLSAFLLAGCGQKGPLYLPESAAAPTFTQQ